MTYVQHFARNTAGRDFAVGDIHGCFTALQAALDKAGFNPATDRLFSVGDLVDRGPESEDADEWLSRPWFHAVRGNHEQMAIDAANGFCDPNAYAYNGGAWFLSLPKEHQRGIADAFTAMPVAIEVETEAGLVGVIHADCPVADWTHLDAALSGPNGEAFQMRSMWDRDRIQTEKRDVVAGVRAVVVGHTPLKTPAVLGNVYHIDTGGWFRDGYFTLLDLATLETIPPMAQKLNAEAAWPAR